MIFPLFRVRFSTAQLSSQVSFRILVNIFLLVIIENFFFVFIAITPELVTLNDKTYVVTFSV